MTLAQCLDEIRILALKGDTQRMSQIAKSLISDLKYKHYLGSEYPRNGWLLSIDTNGIKIFNNDVAIPIPITKKVVPFKRSSEL